MALNKEAMRESFAEMEDQEQFDVAFAAASVVDGVHTLLGEVLHDEITHEQFALNVGMLYLRMGVL